MGKLGSIINFGKDVVADSTNLSDLCIVVPKTKFPEALCSDLVLEGEVIYVLLKSKTEEFCFTQTGLIHAKKNAAVERKTVIKRYNYVNCLLSGIELVTAARIDLSVELQFSINKEPKVISVDRRYLDMLKGIYKVLIEIEISQGKAIDDFKNTRSAMEYSCQAVGRIMNASPGEVLSLYKKIYEFNDDTLYDKYERCLGYDYSELFERYIY